MAVEAENLCFETNMGFGPYFFMGPADLLIEDHGFTFQHLPSSSSSSCYLPLEILHPLFSDLEKQRMEMDWFLQLESKRLQRLILHEETRQQALIMQKYESRIRALFLQKDEELAMARNRAKLLQDSLKGAEMEVRAWEKKASENEAIVSDLNIRLKQVKEDDDTVSFCDSSSSVRGERSNKKGCCKLCQAGRLGVVFFPCRHLCCCKSCEGLLVQCPICGTVKEASLEVLLS